MSRLAKIYCLASIVIACTFVANLVLVLNGIRIVPLTLTLGLICMAWLPISVIGCVAFCLTSRNYLAITAASYAVYVIVNYLATPDDPGKFKLDTATICGLSFFVIYGIGNAWLLKQVWPQRDHGKAVASSPPDTA